MKGLKIALGLVSALFVSATSIANPVQTIFDTSSSIPPKVDNLYIYGTNKNSLDYADESSAIDYLKGFTTYDCVSYSYSPNGSGLTYTNTVTCHYNQYISGSGNVELTRNIGFVHIKRQELSTSCPPDENPLFTFGLDANADGDYESCFNPDELDNASDCASDFNSGSILPASSSSPQLVCATDNDTGKSCAYSLQSGQNSYYQVNLEHSCFGDGDTVPEYNEAPPSPPNDGQCSPYGDSFVCSADPADYCDSSGVCQDACGYVNDQFVCFRENECTGSDCNPSGVNCTENPSHPSCLVDPENPDPENPDPENPDPDNPNDGDGQTGGGGGGSRFVLDYDRLTNGMKDAAKSLFDDADMPDNDKFGDNLDKQFTKITDEEKKLTEPDLYDSYTDSFDGSMFDSLRNLFPSVGQCSPIDFGEFSLDICPAADLVRAILASFLYVMTAFYIFHLFSDRFTRSKV